MKRTNKYCDVIKVDTGKYCIKRIKEHEEETTCRDHPLYKTFSGMKQRCYNSKSKIYKHYGGIQQLNKAYKSL